MKPSKMWEKYLDTSGKNKAIAYESWHFSNNEEDANELAELTRTRVKRATASLHKVYSFENEPIPKVGEFSVVTNWQDEAICIIQVEKVEILPFRTITEEHEKIEGEGDMSLEYWRKAHIKFFNEEANKMGIQFTEDLLVVFERFKVVYPV